tara:strand:+ start:1146 stop:1673 length:528 start_codon:yes stop_codon:yes gene_type:complete
MKIEEFVNKSIGDWRSMRSGHSLAFKHFEEIISNISIKTLSVDDPKIEGLLAKSNYEDASVISPFIINWKAESDWESNSNNSKGSSIIIPIKTTNNEGIMIRSSGYSENKNVITNYKFTSDDSLLLSTNYTETKAEERIWFLNENVRCRSSVLYSLKSNGILQTSFASEIKRLDI